MGKIIDISSRIKNEPTFLKVTEDKNYKIDDSKNTVIEVMAIWDDPEVGDMDKIDKTILKMLGKKAFDEINKMNLPIKDYKVISMAIMATISGESLEEFESRFQDAE